MTCPRKLVQGFCSAVLVQQKQIIESGKPRNFAFFPWRNCLP